MNPNTLIRRERSQDIPGIRHVNEQAFDRPDEADIVDSLRQRGALVLSLVALLDEQGVGHIGFSPVTIKSEKSSFEAIALGPMAVLPSHQRLGIGSQLVWVGLEKCRKMGQSIVIVLGHPEFYPRFGFKPALPFGIRWEQDVPAEVFMVAELQEGALKGRGGVVVYQPEFQD
jgi:putative acetyltransferase